MSKEQTGAQPQEAQAVAPDGLIDLCRFLAAAYCELDELRYSTAKLPPDEIADTLIGKWPVIQGTGNQIKIKRISEQPYDAAKLQSGLAAMLAAATQDPALPDTTCQSCDGHGASLDGSRDCSRCNGTGEKPAASQEAKPVAADVAENAEDIELMLSVMTSAAPNAHWPNDMRHRINVGLHYLNQAREKRNALAAAPQEQAQGAVIERLECTKELLREALATMCADAEATYNIAKAGKPIEISIGQWARLQRAKTRVGAPQHKKTGRRDESRNRN